MLHMAGVLLNWQEREKWVTPGGGGCRRGSRAQTPEATGEGPAGLGRRGTRECWLQMGSMFSVE